MRRYKGKRDNFFGLLHRLRKEEMEEQFDKEAKDGWRFAADAARITDEMASSEDRKHTSGGVCVAVESNLGAVVGAEEGTFGSIPGNEGRIAQGIACLLGVLLALRRPEAVLKQEQTDTPWLIARDANMSPEDFEKSLSSHRELIDPKR